MLLQIKEAKIGGTWAHPTLWRLHPCFDMYCIFALTKCTYIISSNRYVRRKKYLGFFQGFLELKSQVQGFQGLDPKG